MHITTAAIIRKSLGILLAGVFCLFSFHGRADLWVTGYLPGYDSMSPSAIDFKTVTHGISFSLGINTANNTVMFANSLTPALANQMVTSAHAAGRKALICLGGADTLNSFLPSTTASNLPTLINSITNFMLTYHYDGVDIDWEPLSATNNTQFTNLVFSLRNAMNGITPRPLLTVAPAVPPTPTSMLVEVMNVVDQINIQTYELAGTYTGVTWYSSALTNGSVYDFGLLPSADQIMKNCTSAGIPASKLAVGMAFYGKVWSGGGVTKPDQSWSSTPSVTAITYNTIMSGYYSANAYRWDTNCQTSWLSITSGTPAFVSYEDQRACQAKVSYARNHGFGGVMIWELSQDYSGSGQPLMQAVKQALATPGDLTATLNGPDVNLTFTNMPLGSYSVQWTSDFTNWNNLLTTNTPSTSTGGVIQVTDPNVGANPTPRFYQVKTPP